MRKIKYKKGRKLHPNQPEYNGIHTDKVTEMQLFVYDNQKFSEHLKISIKDFLKLKQDSTNNWLNLHGINDVELIKDLTNNLQLNSLIASDILNISRRTSFDEVGDSLFFSIKSILPSDNKEFITVEQISFLLKEGLVVSFQEKKGDFFTHIRERIRLDIGIVRKKKADYLLYLLLDAIIENFFITIENKEIKIEELLVASKTVADPKIMQEIEKTREVFQFLKHSIIPLKEALFTIKTIKDDDVLDLIEPTNFVFFGRLHNKTLELLEQIEYDMNSLESASNFFYTAQNHRMNEVMKILTVISSVFMPLTFIVGLYGMNFDNLPELHYKNAYFIVLGIMFLIVVFMLLYFKRKKWF